MKKKFKMAAINGKYNSTYYFLTMAIYILVRNFQQPYITLSQGYAS